MRMCVQGRPCVYVCFSVFFIAQSGAFHFRSGGDDKSATASPHHLHAFIGGGVQSHLKPGGRVPSSLNVRLSAQQKKIQHIPVRYYIHATYYSIFSNVDLLHIARSRILRGANTRGVWIASLQNNTGASIHAPRMTTEP